MTKLTAHSAKVSIQDKYKKFAQQMHLHYVNPLEKGFTRKGSAKNFRYFDIHLKPLKDRNHLARIKALVIPPAWQDVWISASPRGHIQVTGYDIRGRKQYRYHTLWSQKRNENKFSKIIQFAEKLPAIRDRLANDLNEKGMGEKKILASVVSIMEQTLIRVGNEEYAKQNNSYGLTTIKNGHVKVKGQKIIFDFKGKSGKFHHVELSNPTLAKIVRRCQDLPGQELFAYETKNGEVKDVTSTAVNHYLHEITGEHITAKDFRTWGGTMQAALFLKDKNPPPTQTELKKLLVQAVLHTSSELRNTPAICRKYYIHPGVFSTFQEGKMTKIFVSSQKKSNPKIKGLSKDEIFTKKLIESVSK
ncbi:MAG: DNA topoisomerase IB [Bdellovibrio sp.]|nr:DNA topoisomerase IB [Bdellovibrio sp.]